MFVRNAAASAGGYGGAMLNAYSTLAATACTFTCNLAVQGGGMASSYGKLELTGCVFAGNAAIGGGAMFSDTSQVSVDDCQWAMNSASGGGGIRSVCTDWLFVNCLFTGNAGRDTGGAIYAQSDKISVANCTFSQNVSSGGTAFSLERGESTVRIISSILWNEALEIKNGNNSTVTVRYSDIHDGWSGEGNIDIDPLFTDPNTGDYHLKSQAGRWDPISETWVQDDVTSPCIDAGDPNSPIGYEPFPNGGIINMGAYGGTTGASMSYFGEPVCERIRAGDINGDCRIDCTDLAILAHHWLDTR